jgi:tRNA(Ile)-lysidine synthase
VVVAFSGGSDSLALLAAIAQTHGVGSLHAVYVNHRLRDDRELEAELALNARNCRRLGVRYAVSDLGVGTVARVAAIRGAGTEEAARFLRYERLLAYCREQGARYLATAHTCDDQLETILMRVLQGSPVTALGGIEPVRETDGDLRVIRPVLKLGHEQLRSYLRSSGFSWAEDSTNDSDRYLRNALRHTVSPAILSLFPGAYDALDRLGERTREVSRFLGNVASEAMRSVDFSEGASIALASFMATEPAVRDAVLYRMFDHLVGSSAARISYGSVRRIRQALEQSGPTDRWSVCVRKTVATLSRGVFVWRRKQSYSSYCLELLKKEGKGCIVELPDGVVLSVEEATERADSSLLRIPDSLDHPVVRSPQEGDLIALQGKTVLLSKLFSEWKIPGFLQPSVPVLEDRQGIVAVFGKVHGGRDRLCARFKRPLADGPTNIYSITIRNEYREIQKRETGTR